ncbi:MAG: pyrroline-5-carboxylate reductase, partial [Dehalococcoidales bacterium]|nr:pyrroline-5-carboxylate reductase [Dehalococcoidales bacterium]
AEALLEAAVGLGLSRADAEVLVRQTMLGSARLAEESGMSFSALRRAVTSRGGTTERALAVFEEASLREIVAKAVRAACERARELGSG